MNINRKSFYWQMIRGICILAVILIHCPTGQNYPIASWSCWLTLRQIINFPVAVFIFLAGYFVNVDKVSSISFVKYLTNRGGYRLLLPYAVWSVIYLVKDAISGGIDVNHIIYFLITGKVAGPFYYIIVLLQLTILTPWLVKNRKNWMYIVTPVYLVWVYAFNLITGSTPLLYETLFPAWFMFYLLGMDCREGKWNKVIEKSNLSWILIGLILSIAEAWILITLGCADGFACSQIKISSFIYVIVIVMVLQKKKDGRVNRILIQFGDCSYGIFFCHMLVLQMVRKVLTIAGVDQIWILYWLGTFILTAVGSIVVVKIVQRIVPNKKLMNVIGF